MSNNSNPHKKTEIYRYLPNFLTLLRLLATPFTYFLITNDYFGGAFLCFIFAGISDGVDGYLARRWNVSSRFGRIFDPIADKALMFTTYITLGLAGKLPFLLVVLVIGRDALILLCGFITILFRLPIYFLPVWSSKINTCLQIILVGMVLIAQTNFYSAPAPQLVQDYFVSLLIYLAALTTIWSGCEYGIYFLKQLYFLYKRKADESK